MAVREFKIKMTADAAGGVTESATDGGGSGGVVGQRQRGPKGRTTKTQRHQERACRLPASCLRVLVVLPLGLQHPDWQLAWEQLPAGASRCEELVNRYQQM